MKSNTKQKDGLHFITPTSKIPIYFFTNIYTWSFYLVRIWLLNENASTAVISCFLNKSFVFLYSDETHRLTRRVHHKDHRTYTQHIYLFTYWCLCVNMTDDYIQRFSSYEYTSLVLRWASNSFESRLCFRKYSCILKRIREMFL